MNKSIKAFLTLTAWIWLSDASALTIRTSEITETSEKTEQVAPALFSDKEDAGIFFEQGEDRIAHTSLSMLKEDVKTVFGTSLHQVSDPENARIVAGSAGSNREIDRLIKEKKIDVASLNGKWETFLITTIRENGQPKLIIAGSDSRGTAYGLLELSRMIGVSPWEWWADAIPASKKEFLFPEGEIAQSPSVEFRGIFLNDEDWGLTPWSTHTFEPDAKTLYPVQGRFKGAVGPATYEKIFQLLLRLRANAIWPAMHEVTMPFYFVEGNRQMAEKYGIFIGSSHCEPLSRNSATEWDLAGKGEYNYLTNKDNITAYWSDRLKDLKNSNNIFTIGMRGKHDGPMQGVKTIDEYKAALEQILPDQAALLTKYIHSDISKIPQILIPYKEILDVYKAGLHVPEHVTLMWCDDNYGYITHFPDAKEQDRAGGNGVYYHASYWGRPHDYLWLGSASPALLHQQMKLAYEKNARKIWILNVGDIKAIEYQTELFLDMAWNIDGVPSASSHLKHWLEREFGTKAATALHPLLEEYYRLAFIRKPEFMGNTREEEKDPVYKVVKDLPWSETEIRERLKAYEVISQKTQKIAETISSHKKDMYFQLIRYPVQAAAQMNKKTLYAQLARHGKAEWKQSHQAFDEILSLTDAYNRLNNGKWSRMMDYKPRNLPVFQKVREETTQEPLREDSKPLHVLNGTDFEHSAASTGLGYQKKAVPLKKGTHVSYDLNNLQGDSVVVEVRLLPNHPTEGDSLRFGISLGNSGMQEVDYRTHGRSEEWKENVLRNQAIRRVTLPLQKNRKQSLILTALDEGVVLDQIYIYKH